MRGVRAHTSRQPQGRAQAQNTRRSRLGRVRVTCNLVHASLCMHMPACKYWDRPQTLIGANDQTRKRRSRHIHTTGRSAAVASSIWSRRRCPGRRPPHLRWASWPAGKGGDERPAACLRSRRSRRSSKSSRQRMPRRRRRPNWRHPNGRTLRMGGQKRVRRGARRRQSVSASPTRPRPSTRSSKRLSRIPQRWLSVACRHGLPRFCPRRMCHRRHSARRRARRAA